MQSSLIYHQRKYLALGLPLEDLVPWPFSAVYAVNVAVANVRAKPIVSSTAIGSLSRDTLVVVSVFQGDWAEINDDHWVATKLLRPVSRI
jgi:hypothetical protein